MEDDVKNTIDMARCEGFTDGYLHAIENYPFKTVHRLEIVLTLLIGALLGSTFTIWATFILLERLQ